MSKEVHLLVVEDDDVDAMFVERAFSAEKIANPIIRATDGLDALEKMRDGSLPEPYIVLLDLNMPRMGGLEFLAEIRSDEALRSTIVFVFTTSNDERDRWAAYHHNIAGYLLKKGVASDFVNAVKLLDCYWRVVEFP